MANVEIHRRCLELETELDSINDRIRDIEWRIEFLSEEDINTLLDHRQKALDKKRHVRKELLDLQKEMMT